MDDRVASYVAKTAKTPLHPDTLRPIARDAALAVADATGAFLIDGQDGAADMVLLISNPAFPDAVATAVARGRSIAEHLDAETAAHIVLPLEDGMHEGQSWALFRRLEHMSANRALRILQKNTIVPRVASWLEALALQTRAPVDADTRDARFTRPLATLAADPDISDDIRASVARAQAALEDQSLWLCAEHGDFWTGNVLLSPGRLPGLPEDFHVIDWGGARLDGYPCIDLLRYAMSVYRPGTRRPGQLMRDHLAALDIPSSQGATYVLSAMGHLGQNLDQFPRPRYLELIENVHRFLRNAQLA